MPSYIQTKHKISSLWETSKVALKSKNSFCTLVRNISARKWIQIFLGNIWTEGREWFILTIFQSNEARSTSTEGELNKQVANTHFWIKREKKVRSDKLYNSGNKELFRSYLRRWIRYGFQLERFIFKQN